jgi:hypothetical protein
MVMKKTAMIILFLNFALSAFALELSAGFGGQLSMLASTLSMQYDGRSIWEDAGSAAGFGIFGFFDMTYAEFDMDLRYNSGCGYYYDKAMILSPAIYGKYPFQFDSFSIFPLLGIEYQIHLRTTPKDYELNKMNAFWLKLGAGGSYLFNDKAYLYASFRYGIKRNSKYEEEVTGRFSDVKARYFTHGPDIKFALGYKL